MEGGQQLLADLQGLIENINAVKINADQFREDLVNLGNAEPQGHQAQALFVKLANKNEAGGFEILMSTFQAIRVAYNQLKKKYDTYAKAYALKFNAGNASEEEIAEMKQLAAELKKLQDKASKFKTPIATALTAYSEKLVQQLSVYDAELNAINKQIQAGLAQAESSGAGDAESDQLGVLTSLSDQVNVKKQIIEAHQAELQVWYQAYKQVFPPKANTSTNGVVPPNASAGAKKGAAKNGVGGKQQVKKGQRRGGSNKGGAKGNGGANKSANTPSPFSIKTINAQIKKLEVPIKRACKTFANQAIKTKNICELFRLELEAQALLTYSDQRPKAINGVFTAVAKLQEYVLNTLAQLQEHNQVLQATVGSLLLANPQKPQELAKQQKLLDAVQARIEILQAAQQKTADVFLNDALDALLQHRVKEYTKLLLTFKKREAFIKNKGKNLRGVGADALNQIKAIDKTIQNLSQLKDALDSSAGVYDKLIQDHITFFTFWRNYFLDLAKQYAPNKAKLLTHSEQTELDLTANALMQNQSAASQLAATGQGTNEDDEATQTMSKADIVRYVLYSVLLVVTMGIGAGAGLILSASFGAALVGALIGAILAVIAGMVMEVVNSKLQTVAQEPENAFNTGIGMNSGVSPQQFSGYSPVQQYESNNGLQGSDDSFDISSPVEETRVPQSNTNSDGQTLTGDQEYDANLARAMQDSLVSNGSNLSETRDSQSKGDEQFDAAELQRALEDSLRSTQFSQ